MNRSNDKLLLILMIFAWFVLVPNGAYAQAERVSDLLANTYVQVKGMPKMLAVLAYLSGMLLAFNGILDFKSHVEDPKSVKLREPYTKLIAGGALFALPYMSQAVVGSLFGSGTGPELTATGRNEDAIIAGEVDGMIYNFIADIHGPMLTLITGFAYVCAIIFLFIGINKLVKMSRDGFKGVPPMSVIGNFIVAGALFAFGGMAGTFSTSIFGDATVNTYTFISENIINEEDGKRIAAVIDAVMAFVAMVGFIAFLRGWFVLRDVTEGGKGTVAQAITFLIGGTLAINLGEVINILQTTMGINPEMGLAFQ